MADPSYDYFPLRLALLFLALPFTLVYQLFVWICDRLYPKPLRWEWDNASNPGRKKIDTEDLHFPKGFLWGTATAAHQVEGYCTNNNWFKWEGEKNPETGVSRIHRGQKSGKAADHICLKRQQWNRVKEDVQLMKDAGCNSYRFSVEWSKIEPKEGVFDEAAIKHYRDEIDLLLANQITPMVTLHHFTQPIWFDEKGGWAERENIDYFIRFAERVYQEFSDKVPFWCTFNEPTVFATIGWLQGSFPPGHQSHVIWHQIRDCVNVLVNLMLAHVRVYKQLKAIDPSPQIGIVHNIFHIRPYRRWNPIEYFVAYVGDQLQNNILLKFFKTGRVDFSLPIVGPRLNIRVPEASQTVDFLGLNFYSHMFMRFQFDLKDPIISEGSVEDKMCNVMTDMEYPIYAEGFYLAIKRISEVNPKLPIYITENGVADDDDSRRRLFMKRYIYAMSKAIEDGCDVRGYFYWTLMDNFEWAFGYDMRFGLYEVDYGKNQDGVNATLKRKFRKGSEYFREVALRFK